jgi:DNA-binding NarL/FixJ family response regulator
LAARTHIQLCGELRLESGNTVVEAAAFPGRQGRLAFAYLATHRRAVPRAELAEAIWPDKLPRSWEHDLAAIVSKLRAVLATAGLKDAIGGRSRSYELQLPEASVDAHDAATSATEAEEALRKGDAMKALEAAKHAAESSRRAFMVGEEAIWIERYRAEQAAILVRSLAVSADVLGEQGDSRTAIAHATEAVALEPYTETAYVRLMKLHLAFGNRAEAVRTYERCRTLLADELGVDPSPETEAVYLEALRSRAEATPASSRSKKSSDVTVMLVDDHPLWLETLRQTLERAGACRIVAEATNGKEAVELAAATKPQVVIMDMELPVLDGVKATRKLLAALPDTKVLVLSASSDEDLVVRAVRAGAHGYLLKTAIADDVADAVRRVASGEMVLPAEVAGIVLAELRGTKKARPRTPRRR